MNPYVLSCSKLRPTSFVASWGTRDLGPRPYSIRLRSQTCVPTSCEVLVLMEWPKPFATGRKGQANVS